MPKYGWDVKEHLLFDEEVKRMFDTCKNDYERLAVAIMWRAAPRPMEMMGDILKQSQIKIEEEQVSMTLKTLKLGEGGKFNVADRLMQFARPKGIEQDIYLETIARMVTKTAPEQPMLPFSKRWLERICNRMGLEILGRPITPYHFRHGRMTWLARNGATLDKLKHFKGAADYRSVWGYIGATPFVVSQELARAGEKRKAALQTKQEGEGGQTSTIQEPPKN